MKDELRTLALVPVRIGIAVLAVMIGPLVALALLIVLDGMFGIIP